MHKMKRKYLFLDKEYKLSGCNDPNVYAENMYKEHGFVSEVAGDNPTIEDAINHMKETYGEGHYFHGLINDDSLSKYNFKHDYTSHNSENNK